MALMAKDTINNVWKDIADLYSPVIDGVRKQIPALKAKKDGAWCNTWANKHYVIKDRAIQDGYEDSLQYVSGVEGYVKVPTTLTDFTAYAYESYYTEYPDIKLNMFNAVYEYRNGTDGMYYFDTSNYDTLTLDISYQYDYYQVDFNYKWQTNNRFMVYAEDGTLIGTLANGSGTIDISAYDKVGIRFSFDTRLELASEQDYFNSMTVTVNSLQFE